jgi:hypothetical protein
MIMPGVDVSTVQDLLNRIDGLRRILEQAGDEGRSKLASIDAGVLEKEPFLSGKIDATVWAGLNETKKKKLYLDLKSVFGTLKTAACAEAEEEPCCYGAALLAMSIFLPAAATVLTLVFVLIFTNSLHYSPWLGALVALLAWFGFSRVYRSALDARHAIPSSYDELLPRLDELEVGLTSCCPTGCLPQNPCKSTAYCEAAKESSEIRKDLAGKGLTWALATGYNKVWTRLYRAEEAMIEIEPKSKLLQDAYYDEDRLAGSDISNRDDLLVKLRNAVVSIDPSARKYLKSTTGINVPPDLTIGTTALPGGTVAEPYFSPLLSTGGVPPYKWEVIAGAVPDALVLSAAGILSGTPTNDGHGKFTVRVTDRAGAAVERYFDLIIKPQTQPVTPLSIGTTTPLPWGWLHVEYAERLFATGGKPPYKWEVIAGTIPEGVQLNSAGVVSGTPTKAGETSFTVQATDSAGSTAPPKQFNLSVKSSGTTAVTPPGDTDPEQQARGVLRHVRNSLNEYRNTRWYGLIMARNRLLATFMLTGTILFALLTTAIMVGAESSRIIAAAVFYLVGAAVGVCNRLYRELQAQSEVPDYGLSAARLITIPLFGGLGAIGGLLLVAYLPFAAGVLNPSMGTTETQFRVQVSDTAGSTAPKQLNLPVEKMNRDATTAPQKTNITKEQMAANEKKATVEEPEKVTANEIRDDTKTPEGQGDAGSETPPTLWDIFDLKKNLIGFFVAMLFGLTPGLLFDRLQQQADKYKADLKSSRSTGGTQKS